MSKSVRFDLDTSDFEQSALKLFEHSRRDWETFIREQVRGFLRLVIDFTPPSRGAIRGVKAKKAGEGTIERDVRKVFATTSSTKRVQVTSIAEMRSIMKSKRARRGGKITYASDTKTLVRAALLREFLKQRKARVGYLASGWHAAAKNIGNVRVPAWIGRHNGPGSTSVKSTIEGIIAEICNEVDYASDVSGMERRMQAALNVQAKRMDRRLAHFTEKAAKSAGF